MPNLEIEDIRPLLNAKGNAYLPGVVRGNRLELQKDKLRLNFFLEVESGPHAGKHIYADLWFSPAAMDNSLERLGECFGYTGGMQGLRAADFTGQSCQIHAKIEEYEGKQRIKGGIVKGGGKRVSDDEFANALRALGIEPPAAPAAGKVEDDELPF